MRIALNHYADVNNYGDVLFPHILRHEIKARIPSAAISFFAATDSPCESLDSIRFDRLEGSFDVALIGGGEIVHSEDQMLVEIFARNGQEAIKHPTDIVYGVAQIDARFRGWVGLGVPSPSAETISRLDAALPRLSHVSVRGALSHDILRDRQVGPPLSVIPDLGWLIARMAVVERWSPPKDLASLVHAGNYIAAQIIPDLTAGAELDAAAESLLRISERHNLPIVLTPLTDCWRDSEGASAVNKAAGGRFIEVSPDESYPTRGLIVANARAYVGQSLHGAITAMCHDRPAIIVLHPYNDQKFRETLQMAGCPQNRVLSWTDAPSVVERALDPDSDRRAISERMTGALDTYLDALAMQFRESGM